MPDFNPFHDLVSFARLVREREVSPAELVRAAIARAERVEPQLAAIAYAGFDQATAAAEEPLSGTFAGVPTFIKDTTHVRGMPTRLGSQTMAGCPWPSKNSRHRWCSLRVGTSS